MEIKSLARAFKQACKRQSHMWPARLRIWIHWNTLVLLKCFSVFGMIIDDKFGITISCPGSIHFSSGDKARSIMVLFQLMSTQERRGKKCPTDIQQKQTWLEFPGSVWQPYGQVREREWERERAGFPRQNNGWWKAFLPWKREVK